jgi:cyclophilin family peptidyl-prolyl cis-trans isomerase/HEAT repeat protein
MIARRLAVLLLGLATAACATVPASVAPTLAPASGPVPTMDQKLAAILRLEDTRQLRDPAPPAAPVASAPSTRGRRSEPSAIPAVTPAGFDLLVLLRDPEGRVRRAAALAAGRVGLSEAAPPLVTTLDDADPEVREAAAFALGLIGDRVAVSRLTSALADPDGRVQGRAAGALARMGAADAAGAIGAMVGAKVAAGALARVADDDLDYPLAPDVEAFRQGLYALVQLKAWGPIASAVLDARGEPTVAWWPVAYAVQRVQDGRALPALTWFARRGGVEARVFAARGLGGLKGRAADGAPPDTEVVPALVSLLGDAQPGRLRAAAARALGQVGDGRALPALLGLLRAPDADDTLRLEAVGALAALGSPEAVAPLQDMVSARWAPLRGAALSAIATLDPTAFVFVLSGLDPDPSWIVRAQLASVLGSLDPQVARPKLRAMLTDGDARVLGPVLESLAKAEAPGLEAVLIDFLSSQDVVVRATAARLLGPLKTPRAIAALQDAYQQSKRDGTYVARGAILAALAAGGAEAAEDALREALADPDWAVRRRAAEWLATLGVTIEPSVIRPAPTSHRPERYAADTFWHPVYSPHAYLETEKGSITIELAIVDAPLTVANFEALVGRGFFDDTVFHRVVPGFVIQGGDPREDGEGGPGYTIRDEVNLRPYLRGTVGMALDWADTGGSQFFITHGPQPHLDGRYTVFGRVVEGMDVVDRIARGDRITRVWVWDGVQRIAGPER